MEKNYILSDRIIRQHELKKIILLYLDEHKYEEAELSDVEFEVSDEKEITVIVKNLKSIDLPEVEKEEPDPYGGRV